MPKPIETYTWKSVLSPRFNIPEKDVELVAKRMSEEMLKMRQALERDLWGKPDKETTFPKRLTYPVYMGYEGLKGN